MKHLDIITTNSYNINNFYCFIGLMIYRKDKFLTLIEHNMFITNENCVIVFLVLLL